MVILHMDPDCRDCQSVRQSLEDLAIPHQVVSEGPAPAEGVGPHTLVDDDGTFHGHAEMRWYMDNLESSLADCQGFQSGTCCIYDYEE